MAIPSIYIYPSEYDLLSKHAYSKAMSLSKVLREEIANCALELMDKEIPVGVTCNYLPEESKQIRIKLNSRERYAVEYTLKFRGISLSKFLRHTIVNLTKKATQ